MRNFHVSQVFIIVVSEAFHHVVLDEPQGPNGRLRYLRMPFGISPCKEGKQMYIADTLSRAPLNKPTEIRTSEKVFCSELSSMDLKPPKSSSATFERL